MDEPAVEKSMEPQNTKATAKKRFNIIPSSIACAMITLLTIWVLLFAAGALVTSIPYRKSLALGTDSAIGTRFVNYLACLIFYTPINLGFLTSIAAAIGGCSSRIAYENINVREVLDEAMDATTRIRLKRSLAYMQESVFNSFARGFVVYVAFLAGVLLVNDTPFTPLALPSEQTTPPNDDRANANAETQRDFAKSPTLAVKSRKDAAAENKQKTAHEQELAKKAREKENNKLLEQAQRESLRFMRYAGIISLIAFALGYDPTRFESFLDGVPLARNPGKMS